MWKGGYFVAKKELKVYRFSGITTTNEKISGEISAYSQLDAISILKSEMDLKVIFKIKEVSDSIDYIIRLLNGKPKDKEGIRKVNSKKQRKTPLNAPVTQEKVESFASIRSFVSKVSKDITAQIEARKSKNVKTETIIRHEVVFKQVDTQAPTENYSDYGNSNMPPNGGNYNGGSIDGYYDGNHASSYGRIQQATGLGGSLASRRAHGDSDNTVNLDWGQLKAVKSKRKQKVPMKELVVFSHNMSILLTSGILLLDALEIAKKAFKRKKHRAMIDNVISQVNNGVTLASSMKEQRSMFDEFYISIIEVGEVIGRLSLCFEDLSVNYKMKLTVKKKVRTASIYPMLTLGVLLIMMLLGSKFFIPMFKSIFTASGAKLPAITQLIFDVADVLPNIIIGIMLVSLVHTILYKTIPVYNKYLSIVKDFLFVNVPVVKRYIQVLSLYNFSSAMQLTLKNGISLVEALELGTQSVQNVFYRVQLGSLRECVSNGTSLSDSVAQLNKIDTFTASMLKVGEESGSLGVAFQNISEYQQELLKEQTAVLVELMQPVMLLLMAAILIPVIIGLYLPIIQMSSGGTSGL